MSGLIRMRGFMVLAGLAVLAGCAGTTQVRPGLPVAGETIALSVGPCFGFCPVYQLNVSPGGAVAFVGERHTALLGRKTREAGAASYTQAAAALAAFRPATGATADTTCETRLSDQQHYTLSWTAPDGTVTTLHHDKGCRSARNEALNAALQALPQQLGIGDWAQQTTRPGVSRG